jgi:hypothetical protein
MLLDIILNNDSLTITIEDPFHFDHPSVMKKINRFAASKNISLSDVDVKGLIPKMIRGIAGCESGCPANAKSLVEHGYRNFDLKYIEGGILSAGVSLEGGITLELKMFPEF